MTESVEIIIVIIIIIKDNVKTKKTNAIAKKKTRVYTNVKSTVSINCHSKKVRDYITSDHIF